MSETNQLFQPSIEQTGDKPETKTYNIYHLLFIAFFGGAIPLIVLGTQIANWLNISKKIRYLLFGLGILLLLGKYWAFSLVFQGTLIVQAHIIRYVYKFACVLLYYLYVKVLNKPYKEHLNRKGEITSILKPAIIWMIIGGVIEFMLFGLVR